MRLKRLTYILTALATSCLTAMASPAVQQLTFKNYLGNDENIHPKVLYFKDGWRGYKFWMAYTPYPYGMTYAENPSIAVSNDGLNWSAPENLEYVLDLAPDSFEGYNSDTHLVYREDTDRLECWYRVVNDPVHLDWFNMRSTDGNSWTPAKKMYPIKDTVKFKLCPVVRTVGNRYQLYFIMSNEILMTESGEGFDSEVWSEPEKIQLDYPEGCIPWHLDLVESSEDGWLDVFLQSFILGIQTNNDASIFHCRYNPETKESTPLELILEPDGDKDSPIGRGIYRASLVNTESEQFLYYSGISYSHHRSMFVVHGKNIIEDLKKQHSGVKESSEESKFIFSGLSVSVNGANEPLEVYDTVGRLVGRGHTVTLTTEGLYIFVCGSTRIKRYIGK